MRLRTLPIITAIAAATFVGAAASPAQAGTGLLLAVQINNFQDWGNFNQDPVDHPGSSQDVPGDAIRACDFTADRWGVTVWLDVNRNGTWDRTSTTAGNPSDYCSDWVTGNLTEGTRVTLKACNTKAGFAPKNCKEDDTVA
ncbi:MULTISPECIES: hypothetical protein [Streptomyces]|jgi:hypothetical protein|uniref:Secreted protein n=2 Tax=Streptomyces bottropensis TaxID=42235 RepID=M3FFA0_9ACTN|nr:MULTISPECIES: hypothetical protein [Streptomyces]EMF51565.1 hypothetical protein SBD_7270 [Streptomyces bottropensis ATCC 25435]MZD20902.1 hypothetical protein [Streptomyces sp. SID5476]